jgi:thioglycine synthase
VRPLLPADYWQRELAHPLHAQERRAFEAMADWTGRSAAELVDLLTPTVLAHRETVAFTDLPHTPGLDDPRRVLDDLLGRLDGFDVLTVVADNGSAAAVKVIVPGLEAETMSYGRIGARAWSGCSSAGATSSASATRRTPGPRRSR